MIMSYFGKVWTALSIMGFAYGSGSIYALVMGVIFMFDAIVGLSILN
jgi:hypothetical protein